MKHLGVYCVLLPALLAVLFETEYTFADASGRSSSHESTSVTKYTRSSGGRDSSGVTRGLPNLHGLTNGLGLGLGRKRRAVTNKKPTGKDSACNCPAQSAPVCGSDGKTYSNKCTFQCALKKLKSQVKKPGKNSSKKAPSLKIAKKGRCTPEVPPSSTTAASPVDTVHHTVTELTDTVHQTVTEHVPDLGVGDLLESDLVRKNRRMKSN